MISLQHATPRTQAVVRIMRVGADADPLVTIGEARNKKDAEQQAARAMLELYRTYRERRMQSLMLQLQVGGLLGCRTHMFSFCTRCGLRG